MMQIRWYRGENGKERGEEGLRSTMKLRPSKENGDKNEKKRMKDDTRR